MKKPPLRIAYILWENLLAELRRRGDGERESGAFLLASTGSLDISRFLCYDDLDPTALEMGIITFHAAGFVRLWDYCQSHGLTVVADVHTHPSDWTGQSESDRTHPMVAIKGHIALILPNYAAANRLPLNGASVYEYRGSHKWKAYSAQSAPFKIAHL